MFMQSMHVFAIDTDLHFNTFMSIANSVCNGLKELIDYVHVDEDRVIGSSIECRVIKPCMWKKKAH